MNSRKAIAYDGVFSRSARLQVSLLEADRVVRRRSGEASFHVFYYLWEGAEGALRERLQLDSIEQPAIVPYSKEDDRQSAKEVGAPGSFTRRLSAERVRDTVSGLEPSDARAVRAGLLREPNAGHIVGAGGDSAHPGRRLYPRRRPACSLPSCRPCSAGSGASRSVHRRPCQRTVPREDGEQFGGR